jgi:CheY-like chemotaxis protein
MDRILIIDDEQEVRDLYRSLLEGKPCLVDEAANGQDALKLAMENPYDLYLTDIMMPKMSGFDFLRNLREIDRNAVVVIISGFDDIAYNRQALMYGAWRYLVKPVKRAEMWLVVEQGIKERRRVVPPIKEGGPPPVEFIDAATFDLLARWEANQTPEFFLENEAEFDRLLFAPFLKLWNNVLRLLPPTLPEALETDHDVFEPLMKKTHKGERPRSSYYAALAPRRGSRNEEGQLYLAVDARQIEYGFFVGEYGADQRTRLLNGLQQYRQALQTHLRPRLDRLGGVVGLRLAKLLECRNASAPKPLVEQWLDIPPEAGVHFSVVITRDRIPAPDVLAKAVAEAFSHLYPLVLLAQRDQPGLAMAEYLGTARSDWADVTEKRPTPAPAHETPPPTLPAPQPRPMPQPAPEESSRRPEYPSEQVAAETGAPLEIVGEWLQNLHRLGAGILCAEPGMGKTFAAEALARCLTAGGLGLVDVIPLHEAVDYLSLMRCIIDFVSRIGRRSDPCALVLDDLHRLPPGAIGELPYLLDHRGVPVTLAYEGMRITLPANLILLATVNRDRLDAIPPELDRRLKRFAYDPHLGDLIARGPLAEHAETLGEIFTQLRAALAGNGRIVHPLRWIADLPGDFDQLANYWRREIEPLLEDLETDGEVFRWDRIAERLGPTISE